MSLYPPESRHVDPLPVVTKPKPIGYLAPAYVFLVPRLAEAARGCGYALAVHGSMARDLDLVAVPWVDEAKSVEDLVEALLAACDLDHEWTRGPTTKPHGRVAWSIYFHGGCYLDVSVLPRLAK